MTNQRVTRRKDKPRQAATWIGRFTVYGSWHFLCAERPQGRTQAYTSGGLPLATLANDRRNGDVLCCGSKRLSERACFHLIERASVARTSDIVDLVCRQARSLKALGDRRASFG